MLNASKKVASEVGVEETSRYSRGHVSSRDCTPNDDIRVAIKYFENVSAFSYLGTTVQIRIRFTKELRADYVRGMLANMQFIASYLPV